MDMILAIETSTPHASLAVLDATDGAVLREWDFVSERAHNAVIFDPVTEVLAAYRDSLRGIAVGLGPGSYGGVRVGLAVANGLSLVLGAPVTGVSSLEAWDSPVPSYTVLGDARRKTFFRARVEGRRLAGEPELLAAEDAVVAITAEIAAGAGPFFTADPAVSEAIPGVILSFPRAAAVAARALAGGAGTVGSGVGGEIAIPEPHYLRAPYITVPRGK